MSKRYIAIWFRHLATDRLVRSKPELKDVPFVLSARERGRLVVKAANTAAQAKGIDVGMVVADCRAILPGLPAFEVQPGQAEKLLHAFAEWCLRYTPVAAVDLPDGLVLDVSGCAHLWGGERPYLKDMLAKLRGFGYDVRAAMADTVGAAWAVSRFGRVSPIVAPCGQMEALLPLPPAALRLEAATLARLEKLGLHHIRSFINMPRHALRRRFGPTLLLRLDQALGQEPEQVNPIRPVQPYQERLASMEPIRTATGIEIALKQLLERLCLRLAKEEKGLRKCIFKGYRIDGNVQQVGIGTNRPSRSLEHLFHLFEQKIPSIEPALGIEVFTLDAPIVEDIPVAQDALWHSAEGGHETAISELLDRIAGKLGEDAIHRYLPDEHYMPERSIRLATSLTEQASTAVRPALPRPIHLLPVPEAIEVTVPMPDYPPLLFKHKGALHHVAKADGPERIEQEWWLEQGLFRDYYCVEDGNGSRYWLFRLGSYDSCEPKWFIHGFFA
jgi:protein ImuB